MEIINVSTKEEIEKLGSALTIEGLAEDSFSDFIDWIKQFTPLKRERIYKITGKLMNEIYQLSGNNKYNDDLTIASVDLKDIDDYSPLIINRFRVGARWLDDIIDNNIRREGESK